MRTLSKIFDWQVVKKSIIASIVILTLIASRSDLYAKTEELQFDHPLDVGGILFNGGFIQDRDGFFWIATQSGLVKYDGYDLKKYTSGAPGSISSDVVFSIYEDSDGILWCTTSNGLNRYDKNTDSFTVYKHNPDKPNSISHNVYNWANQTIAQDGDGNLWFGTQRGLNKFDKFTEFFTSYAHDPDNPESLGSDNILAVFIDKQNVLWVGTDNGLDKFDASAETFIHYGHEPNNDSSLSHNVVGAIFEDEKGGLWVGTRGGGLNRFEKETESFTRYLNDKDNPDSISDNFVYSINEFERGEIWVAHGGDGIGLDILDAGTGIFTHYKHEPSRPNSLSNDHIMNVYEDSTGIIWTVIFDGKLDKLDNESEKFKLYQHDPDNDNSVGDNVIFVVFEDEDGIMWIGSDTGGLDRYDPKTGTFAHYKHDPSDPNSLPDSYVIGILEDSDGNFWLMSDNLWLFDRELGKVVRVFPIEAEYGSTIIEDSENSDLLWIATSSGGLGKFEKNTQTSTNYTHDPNDPNSISNNVVWQIFQDREGMIWIPTYGGGLDKFDPNTGKVAVHYKHDPDDPTSIGSDTVNHVYQDSEGNIWVGVVGGGLNKLNVDGTFTRYTEQNGFLTNNVTNIIEDDNGFLWLGTKIGLVRFDPKTEATKLYTQSDGLQSNEFWEYPHLKTRDGQLWVYGANGANSFYPDALEDNPYTPPVVVTSLTQGGEKMNVGKAPERVREITLDWQYNYFEFEFVALNYTSPEKNQYKYMLEGVDQDWYDSGTRRFGRYTGLPPGDYVLRIIGSNNDGVWNEEGVSISVTVTPPFWRTWWFIALCVAGVFGVLGTIYQARIQRSKSKRLAALALQESEARLRQVVENMPVMLDALDANGNNIVWNKECERVTGYSAEEIVNNPQAMELLYPDAAYRKRMLAARAERGDDYYDWEWQITCKDGTVKTVAWSNISRRLPIPGWATWGIGVNITERKRAEELLRESESKLRKLFERSTDAIFLVDTETGRYLDANRAAEILTGRSVKEITTLTTNDITPANARERLKTVRQTLKETTTLGQIVYQRPDGTERLVLLSAIPIQDNLVFGLAHDITERVQVEKERELLLAQIRVQARQMQGIIDTVPEGVLLLDADGRVVLANPVAKQDLLTLVGQDIISTHAPITRLGDRSLAELLTSPPAKGLWHETKADDRIFEIIARPMMPAADSRLSTDSQSENWVMVINDVTRERVARGHQHRQERLAAVGQLAAGIAHDFNNMLTVIMLYTHQLTRQEQPSDITVSAAEIIINESKRASKLVGQILDFSRRSSLEISPMDLKPFIKETVRVLERTLPENIRLYLDVGGKEPTTPFIVKGDPTRIQQVLMNLVVNARDAMPQGGDLRIELTCIELRPGDTPPRIEMLPEGLPEGEWICMSVSDTGAGIPPHVMDHIFEPFFSTKGPGEGTGLGLAQVHGIVGAHAGHIGIETELANDGIGGTTFRIYLPSSKGKQDATEEKVSTISQGQGETILLVEDNENLREGGNKLLKSLGYRVLTGANGHEALMLYQSMKGIDLVITDIVMPEMGGKELVIELRKINPDLKVLAVTGYIVDKDMQELRDAGFSNVVYKPFEVDKLAQVIRRTLDEG